MGLSLTQLADRLRNRVLGMMPTGAAWEGENWSNPMRAWFLEFARVEERVADMLDEAIPSSADETLDAWEAVYGLPDACGTPGTDDERREVLTARVVDTGEATAQRVSDIVAEYSGIEYGGIRYESMMTCEDDCESAVYDEAVSFLPIIRLQERTAAGSFDFAAVECGLDRLAVSYSNEGNGPYYDELLSNSLSVYDNDVTLTGSLCDAWANDTGAPSVAGDFTASGAARPTAATSGGYYRFTSTTGIAMSSDGVEDHWGPSDKDIVFALKVTAHNSWGPLRALGSDGTTALVEIATDGSGSLVAKNRDANGYQTTAGVPYDSDWHVWHLRHRDGVLTLTRDPGQADSASASVATIATDYDTHGYGDVQIGEFGGEWGPLHTCGIDLAQWGDASIQSLTTTYLAVL